MEGIKIVKTATEFLIGKVTIMDDGTIVVDDCIQMVMNPMNQQINLTNPLLFGKPGGKVVISPSMPTMITEPDDKVLEEYKKAITAASTGIVPAKSIPKDKIIPVTK